MDEKHEINPQTSVADLLKNYPELEGVLAEMAPVFKKIQNPLLRKTVAKIASLEKAAEMAEISVVELVGRLRREAGLPEMTGLSAKPQDTPSREAGQEPHWVGQYTVKQVIEADKMLESGVHPLNMVISGVKELEDGESIMLTSSFPPIPLADALKQQGHSVHIRVNTSGSYETFFKK